MLDYIYYYRAHYKTNHIFIPMGCDFTYLNAHLNFRSMDNLIDYFNFQQAKNNIVMKYSTPGIYLDEVISTNTVWPTKYDDMFPYGDDPNDYWTGYFTSRPTAKGYVRTG